MISALVSLLKVSLEGDGWEGTDSARTVWTFLEPWRVKGCCLDGIAVAGLRNCSKHARVIDAWMNMLKTFGRSALRLSL
jgi:hypothetical protein